MRVMRSVLALLVALALSLICAPSAMAATTTTTLTGQVIGYTGISAIDLYHWNGSSFEAVPDRDDQTALGGAFSITADLVAGDVYTVRASAVGKGSRYYGGSTTKPTTADAGFVADASTIDLGTFSLGASYALNGTVLDETGTALPGATVKVFTIAADPSTDAPLSVGESGDDGGYGFNQLAVGSYRVVASAPGYLSAYVTGSITLASITVADLSLPLGQSSISGVVRLPSGSAAADASVQVYRWVDDDWTLDRTLTAGSDGSYQFRVATKSKLMLFAKATGYIGRWSGGAAALPPDSSASEVLTAADGYLVPDLQLTTGFGRAAGQELSFCTQHTLPATAAYNEAQVDLGFTADLYGSKSSSVFVTDRGFIYLSDSSLRTGFAGSDPSALDAWEGAPIIAPLWFDGDTSGTTPGAVTYGSSADGRTFCAIWSNLGHYSGIEDNPNTFQLILQSKTGATGRASGDVDITVNYDQVLWDGAGSRAVGYTAGDKTAGHFWVYDGSTNPGVITDSGSSPLISHSLGSTTAGRYVFSIKNTPANTVLPTISVVGGGDVAPRATLAVQPGAWSPAPTAFTYQWALNGSAVPGATGSTWVIPDNSAGKTISVEVTPDVDADGVSPATASLVVGQFTALAPPAITGTPKVGAELGVSESWSLQPTTRSYAWFLNEVPAGAGATFVVPPKSEGKRVTVTVTASKLGYAGVVAASSAPVTVLKQFSKRPTPTISGKVKVGSTLSVKTGTWSPKATLSRQWYRDGVSISGATGSKYKVKLADVGTKLTVRVTAAKSGYLGVTKTSKATKTVPKVPLHTATPTIGGTAKVGRMLTVSPGHWTSGAAFTYRWYRSGKLIVGASGKSYVVQLTDKGKKITVKVTGSKLGYTTVTRTSKATRTVS